MSYLVQMLTSSRKPVMILASAFLVLALFLFFPAQPAEAASMTFSSDTTISSNATIGAGETWTINPGVTLTIAPGVTISTIYGSTINNLGTINNTGTFNVLEMRSSGTLLNSGTIGISLDIFNTGTLFNTGTIEASGVLVNNNGGTVNNYGTIINGGSELHNINGTMNNYGTINNFVGFENEIDGIINNFGTINNKCGSGFHNNGGIFTGNPIITEECFYNLNLFEGSNPSDGVIHLGDNMKAVVDTNNQFIFDVTFEWIDPSGNVDSTKTVRLFDAEDTFTPDEVGTWTIKAHLSDGDIIVQTLHVDFMVIPESPIGTIALMASIFAALGGFVLMKKKGS